MIAASYFFALVQIAADGPPSTLATHGDLEGKVLLSAPARIDSLAISNSRHLTAACSDDKPGSQIVSYRLPLDGGAEYKRFSTPFRVKSVAGFDGADKILLLSEMKVQAAESKNAIPLGAVHAVWEGDLNGFDPEARIVKNEMIRFVRADGMVLLSCFGSDGRHAVATGHTLRLFVAESGKIASFENPVVPFNFMLSGVCASREHGGGHGPFRLAVGLRSAREYSEELSKKLVETPPEIAAIEALKAKDKEPRPLFDQLKKDLADFPTGIERLMLFDFPSKAPEMRSREILSRPSSILGRHMNLAPIGFSPDGNSLFVLCDFMETKSVPTPVRGIVRIDLTQSAKGRQSRELVAGNSAEDGSWRIRPTLAYSRTDQLLACLVVEVRHHEDDNVTYAYSLMIVDLKSGKRHRFRGPGTTNDELKSERLPSTFLPGRTFAMAVGEKIVGWKVP